MASFLHFLAFCATRLGKFMLAVALVAGAGELLVHWAALVPPGSGFRTAPLLTAACGLLGGAFVVDVLLTAMLLVVGSVSEGVEARRALKD